MSAANTTATHEMLRGHCDWGGCCEPATLVVGFKMVDGTHGELAEVRAACVPHARAMIRGLANDEFVTIYAS